MKPGRGFFAAALVLGLLGVPSPGSAVPSTTLTVDIVESTTEGGLITVTLSPGVTFVGTPLIDAESASFTITIAAFNVPELASTTSGLAESSLTGALSDLVTVAQLEASELTVEFASDVEGSGLGTCAPPISCIVEDGTLQTLITVQLSGPGSNMLLVRVQSAVEGGSTGVPEPASLVLLGAGLTALATLRQWWRRTRSPSQTPYSH